MKLLIKFIYEFNQHFKSSLHFPRLMYMSNYHRLVISQIHHSAIVLPVIMSSYEESLSFGQ